MTTPDEQLTEKEQQLRAATEALHQQFDEIMMMVAGSGKSWDDFKYMDATPGAPPEENCQYVTYVIACEMERIWFCPLPYPTDNPLPLLEL